MPIYSIFAAEFYEDKPFNCRACGKASVFTAEQQKYTYEVKKAHTWEQHVLCAECFEQRNGLQARAAEIATQWKQQKSTVQRDVVTLKEWKEVLEALPKYGVREDSARILMLAKLLDNAP